MTTTYFWHDYETFGTDPQRDKICQFAGIRTDMDFNPVDEPVMWYCKPSIDYLPQPEACLITGITPQHADQAGVCEAEFTRLIHQQLAEPGTCGVGYNNIRFDDEVTRNLLYRNFYDPYAREWQQGNSRWDLIDIVRAVRALRPAGINWPVNAEGLPSFKLEELTKANHISHTAAHDALADVYATLAIAKLIKTQQPRIYDFLFANRSKAAVMELLNLGSFTPLVHVSGRFPARNNCLAVILPLCRHPYNQNEVIVYDLAVDPQPLLALSASEIQQRLFVATADLPSASERIPLKTIHINKCPVLAPIKVIQPADAERLNLDLAQCNVHLQLLKTSPTLDDKLAEVYQREAAQIQQDPDTMIYSGGFFTEQDKRLLTKIRITPPNQLAKLSVNPIDSRIPEMLFRYRARNYPETLSAPELAQWQHFCNTRLTESNDPKYLTFSEYFQKIQTLQNELGAEHTLLNALSAYGQQLSAMFNNR